MLRIHNDGAQADSFTFSFTGSNSAFTVTSPYKTRAGTTPTLQPGKSFAFTVRVHRNASARTGAEVLVRMIAHSIHDQPQRDGVTLRVRATAS